MRRHSSRAASNTRVVMKPAGVLHHEHDLAAERRRELASPADRLAVRGLQAAGQLEQPHEDGRVKEVSAD
jgi:hypothetical protein